MKIGKQSYLIVILSLIVLLISACSNPKSNDNEVAENEIPKLTVKIGDMDFSSNVISKRIQKIDKENTEVFQNIIKNDSISYFSLGTTVKLQLANKDSTSYKLLDYVLREDGTLKFSGSTIKETEGKFDKGINSFTFDENLAIKLSSSSKNFEQGKIIRGFKLIYNWKDKMYEYDFVIRTDDSRK
ncbi:hypothetical protein JHL18_04695 [Clostridium sp. YIM B02505]|uniref:DUF4352 domain-containing protein n=1 Tax=Clostridium yunnanense TaxID=2800325 RepID=A0ABS1EKR3_9CLOT|nr:hypothetical protein [Clostridium yunnanense]MBK1809939.1 hypothetical protein [Clostridium yunnanense]